MEKYFKQNENSQNKIKNLTLSDLIDQKNFLLEFDELGNPKIEQEVILSIEKDSNLILKVINGTKISKNLRLICDRKKKENLNFPIEYDINNNSFNIGSSSSEQEYISSSSQAEDNKNQEIFQNLQGESIEKELYEANSKLNSDSGNNNNNNINQKSQTFSQELSIEELKEIAKNSDLKNFKFSEFIENVSTQIPFNESDTLSENIFDKKILKIFGDHLLSPIECNNDLYFIVPCKSPGPLTFFFAYEKEYKIKEKKIFENDQINNENLQMENEENSLTKEFHILIEPKLKIGEDSEIDLDSLSMQTILSKSLGKLDEWENYFKEANLLKYNIIHFTPIQIIGKSDSLYCLNDQREINNIFFKEPFPNKFEKFKLMKNKITQLKDKYKLSCLVDIVLNHTASNSQWLKENPNSGFNLENSSHLTVSWELEKVIMDYSKRFSAKKVECNSAPYINNENDLNELISELSREIFHKNFEEFFLIRIESAIENFIGYYKNYQKNFEELLLKKKYLLNKLKEKKLNFQNENDVYKIVSESADNYGSERFGVKINTEFVSILLLKENQRENEFLSEVKKHLNNLNAEWRKKAKDLLNQALENIKSTAKYEFIEQRRFKVTEKRKIVENYFTYFDPQDKTQIFACNGWLWGVPDPTINFAKYGYWNYFNRSIVIWGDCVKLNYGEKFEDSPYLWSHMTEYICQMAYLFDGFRLDNAHSTPVYLAQYLMKKAREVNPNLIIMAELFAGTKEREVKFINKIGINLLIREIIYSSNVNQLDENIYKYGGGKEKNLGKLDKEFNIILSSGRVINYEKLKGMKPKEIVFDLTHDNPTLYEKHFNLGLNLTFLCCNSMCASSIGTTRGFDQLYPYQPSVVKENRMYAYDEYFEEVLWKNTKFLGEYFDEDYEDVKILNKKKLREETDKIDTKNDTKNDELVTFEFNSKNNGLNYSPKKICVALSSHGWKADFTLDKVSNDLFKGKINLKNGTHFYKFVVDGNWMFDKTKPTSKDNSNHINNIINIGNNNNNNTSNIPRLDFYLNYKDLKIVRRELNYMRKVISEKSEANSSEFYLNREKDIIFIYRSLIKSKNCNEDINFDGYAMISRTGFEKDLNSSISANFELPGIISELVFFSNINVPKFDLEKIRSEQKLNGVDANILFSKNIQNLFDIANVNRVNGKDHINFHAIKPNTNILLKIKFEENKRNAIFSLNEKISQLKNESNLIKRIEITDLNHALFSCEAEELDKSNKKRGNYEFKEIGKLVYAGISHLNLLLQQYKINQILNNKIFENVREGDWLIEYTVERLKDSKGLIELANYLTSNVLENFILLPIYLKPKYLTKIIDALNELLVKKFFSLLKQNNDLDKKGEFYKNLLIASLQFLGNIQSAKFHDKSNSLLEFDFSVAAGLSHFCTEYMRCWGRDTFISFKGLFLIPGFFKEAKQILINFSSTMRHGLIPNLLDGGNNPRYNARDSVWFYLQAIKDYLIATNDFDFMNHEIKMLFLDDDMNKHYEKLNSKETKFMKIHEIIIDILTKHVNGISFREWKAGKQIDEHMKDEGFNININFDKETGFFFGGNKSNCGTWMDKMGSSEKALNKGIPGSSRDGANVELIGLCYSVITFFDDLNKTNKNFMNQNWITLSNMKILNKDKLEFSTWANMIKENFEKYFFVGKKIIVDNIYTKENYYKDYVSFSGKRYNEYQFRPNYLIAIAVAPELFSREKALIALCEAEKYLLVENGMGVRTLDFEDKFYRGDYDNSNDSNDFYIAHGLNYHNGPEWVWPIGYYIIAKNTFNNFIDKDDLKRYVCNLLIPHYENIMEDPWRGIPELTDKDNKLCRFSCRTQAWSIATILDGLDAINK